MKSLQYYDQKNLKSESEVFQYFKKTLLQTNRLWSYFVNWSKTHAKIDEVKVELKILESLCNSNCFDQDLDFLLKNYPQVVEVLPILIAYRDRELCVFEGDFLENYKIFRLDFFKKNVNENDRKDIIYFVEQSGLKRIIQDGFLRNFNDFAHGVEVGLDSNARKNRGGGKMEIFVEGLLKKVYCLKRDDDYIFQASPCLVKDKWDLDLPVNKTSRRPDFIVRLNKKLIWIETNFYNGSGSKLKSTAGEYKSLFNFCQSCGIKFVWITDGMGWKTTIKPLEETFQHNDYVFNLHMVKDGVLNELLYTN